ncbi:MAG TPA: type II toxin-antitoxin system HicB family antitoxin [Acidiferrobacteraceae bacterium]|nr:type II toxin-antitoxin system HicB family antitoxin [Acidiferrobacteraceae bacterium]
MRAFEYPVWLTPAEEGGFVVTCRDLPEVITQGEDLHDALMRAADAMEEAFAARIDDELEFPLPSEIQEDEHLVAPSAEMVAKAALYVALREAEVSKTELARRLGVDEKVVRRLLDPHYRSKLPRLAEAVQALGRRLRIELAA